MNSNFDNLFWEHPQYEISEYAFNSCFTSKCCAASDTTGFHKIIEKIQSEVLLK